VPRVRASSRARLLIDTVVSVQSNPLTSSASSRPAACVESCSATTAPTRKSGSTADTGIIPVAALDLLPTRPAASGRPPVAPNP